MIKFLSNLLKKKSANPDNSPEIFEAAFKLRNPITTATIFYLTAVDMMILAACSDEQYDLSERENIESVVSAFCLRLDDEHANLDHNEDALLRHCKLMLQLRSTVQDKMINEAYGTCYNFFLQEREKVIEAVHGASVLYADSKYNDNHKSADSYDLSPEALNFAYGCVYSVYKQVAYIIQSDMYLDSSEISFLDEVEKGLSIFPSHIKETRDRYIAPLIPEEEYETLEDEKKIAMPKNLDDTEKRSFLNRQFLIWNQRLETAKSQEEKKIANENIDSIIRLRKKILTNE